MPDPNIVAATALADELRLRGVEDVSVQGAKVSLLGPALEVYTDETSFQPATDASAVSVVFDARAKGADAKGVCVLSTGFGEVDRDAARDAAVQWCTGVYPTLVTWLTQTHVCDVAQSQMIVALASTDERFGWRAHLGPIIWRLYGEKDAAHDIGEVDQSEIFHALFNVLHPFAAHRNLFWVECFVARYPDGSVDTTCRLHNEDWEEGEQALLSWASSWPDTGGCLLSKRQFILFEPAPVSDLSNGGTMEALEKERKETPWWKRLLGR